MTNNDQDIVYTLRAVPIKTEARPKPPGEAMTIEADRFGNVLFREEPVPIPLAKLDDGLTKCFAVARSILTKASNIAAGYEVDSITLKQKETVTLSLEQAGLDFPAKFVQAHPLRSGPVIVLPQYKFSLGLPVDGVLSLKGAKDRVGIS